jgi:hypothetical protein
MYGKLLKTIKCSMMTGEFCMGFVDKTLMVLNKAAVDLSYCNTVIFTVYLPVFQDILI